MAYRSLIQRKRLLRLATLIASQREPLGIGLKNGCWAGVAINLARQEGYKATEFYGLSMNEVKTKIKRNKRTPPTLRNAVMAGLTLLKSVS